MISRKTLFTAAILAATAAASGQSVNTITSGGLGFPVPQPAASLTEVAGYRSVASLQMRHAALALSEDHVTEQRTGTTRYGRAIQSYRVSSAGSNTLEGIAKPAMMMQGTIHAREWQSPEGITRVLEWLALEKDTDPVAGFLAENAEIVIHPIGNLDGFIQTQTYFNQTVSGSSSGAGGRDGRMRRKNMRHNATSQTDLVDEVLSTFADYQRGVDLNRNHQFGWPNSTSETSITYSGPTPGSEPESQALYVAASLLNESRIRFYIDLHSYSQLFYIVHTGNAGQETNANRIFNVMVQTMSALTGRDYSGPIYVDMTSGGFDGPIGATDEYFAGTYDAMSYTLETRPTGGSNGFILAESQVEDLRDEIQGAARAGFYFAAGPPTLTRVAFYDTTDGSRGAVGPVFEQVRQFDSGSGQRQLQDIVDGQLAVGRKYTAVLSFNKPMREFRAAAANLLPGVTGAVTPTVALTGLMAGTNPRWEFANAGGPLGYRYYPGDTVLVDFDLTSIPDTNASFPLSVTCIDMAGLALDANPLTVVDWSASGWTNYENTAGTPGQTGGTDSTTQVSVAVNSISDFWILE